MDQQKFEIISVLSQELQNTKDHDTKKQILDIISSITTNVRGPESELSLLPYDHMIDNVNRHISNMNDMLDELDKSGIYESITQLCHYIDSLNGSSDFGFHEYTMLPYMMDGSKSTSGEFVKSSTPLSNGNYRILYESDILLKNQASCICIQNNANLIKSIIDTYAFIDKCFMFKIDESILNRYEFDTHQYKIFIYGSNNINQRGHTRMMFHLRNIYIESLLPNENINEIINFFMNICWFSKVLNHINENALNRLKADAKNNYDIEKYYCNRIGVKLAAIVNNPYHMISYPYNFVYKWKDAYERFYKKKIKPISYDSLLYGIHLNLE